MTKRVALVGANQSANRSATPRDQPPPMLDERAMNGPGNGRKGRIEPGTDLRANCWHCAAAAVLCDVGGHLCPSAALSFHSLHHHTVTVTFVERDFSCLPLSDIRLMSFTPTYHNILGA